MAATTTPERDPQHVPMQDAEVTQPDPKFQPAPNDDPERPKPQETEDDGA